MDVFGERAREGDEGERLAEREPTVIELMNGPGRPSEQRRKTVLWISLTFATGLLAMTCAVIYLYGLDLLTLFTAIGLIFLAAAMIGALRYKGEDPMAQFEPPGGAQPKRHRWRG